MKLIMQRWGVDGKIHSLKKGLQIRGKADIINELQKNMLYRECRFFDRNVKK